MPNFVVSSLPDYVKDNRDLIVREVVLGGRTIQRMQHQTGIKGSAPLHYLDVQPVIQGGGGCSYDPNGTAELTDRMIVTAVFKVNMDICPETIRGKWAEHLLRTNANGEPLPFEQEVIDGIRASIDEQLERIVWQSSLAGGGLIDGLLTIANAEASVIDVAIPAGTSAYQGILLVYDAIPEKTLKKGVRINVSPAIFRAFTQELVSLNLFHYDVPNEDLTEVFLPGTGVRVIKVEGLEGSLQILATYDRNMYYGTDLENDREVFKVVYDEKTEGYSVIVKWNSGVQFAFPDEIVVGTFASAPARPEAVASLAAIAQNTAAIADAVGDSNELLQGMETDLSSIDSHVGTLADVDHIFKTQEQAAAETPENPEP